MEFITQNGHYKIVINAAPLKDAQALKRAVWNEAGKLGLNLDNLGGIQAEKFLGKLADLVIALDGSEVFENAIFKCLENCLYDGVIKINQQLFDDKSELRADYYEIVSACAEENLRPFFKSLVTALKLKFQQIEADKNQPLK